jgi:CRP/FNR family transcriptional regulator, cyclic AMP receptor protein
MTVTSTFINVLEGLSTDEVDRFVALCEQSKHLAGEPIFTEGDEGDDVYIVRSGRVRIAKAISLDVDRTLTVLGKGGIFGELAIVGEGVRSASAIAEEDTTVLALSKASFVKLTEEAPALGLKIMGRFAAMLAERLRVTTDLLRDTVQWGLEVSGAAGLDLERLTHAQAGLTVTLVSGDVVSGRLLAAEKNDAGILLTISGDDDQLSLVPYHAVVSICTAKALLGGEE